MQDQSRLVSLPQECGEAVVKYDTSHPAELWRWKLSLKLADTVVSQVRARVLECFSVCTEGRTSDTIAIWSFSFLPPAPSDTRVATLEAQGKDCLAVSPLAWVSYPAPRINLVSQTHPGQRCLLQTKGLEPVKNGQ